MRGAWNTVRRAVRVFWRGVREWSGDAAYETYVRSVMRTAGGLPLSREEFYVQQLDRKYSRVSRCC